MIMIIILLLNTSVVAAPSSTSTHLMKSVHPDSDCEKCPPLPTSDQLANSFDVLVRHEQLGPHHPSSIIHHHHRQHQQQCCPSLLHTIAMMKLTCLEKLQNNATACVASAPMQRHG